LTANQASIKPCVSLVGAGPGAPDLLTVRAVRALETADVIVYDALVTEAVLGLAPDHVRKIGVGKRGHRASTSQSFINKLMVRLALQGARVVRLKGGDPSIFGRAQEEIAVLEAAGVEVEIIPGITTASAAAAQFGFPLTQRGSAQSVLFLTGRTVLGMQANLRAAADPTTTLCLYMGCADCEDIANQLMKLGRSAKTPALIARNVGRFDATMEVTNLANLGSVVAAQTSQAPGLIIIGEVCASAHNHSALVDDLRTHVA
jgi:uroporphyrin-III C-methyltransferase